MVQGGKGRRMWSLGFGAAATLGLGFSRSFIENLKKNIVTVKNRYYMYKLLKMKKMIFSSATCKFPLINLSKVTKRIQLDKLRKLRDPIA